MKSWRLTIPILVLMLSLVLPGAATSAQTAQLPALPGQPTNVDAHGMSMAAYITWDAPTVGTPTRYQVNTFRLTLAGYQPVPGALVTFRLPTLAIVTHLANTETYAFTVTPFSGALQGSTSALSRTIRPSLIGPAQPVNLQAAALGGDVTLTWTRPPNTPVDHYLLFVYPSGGSILTYQDAILGTAATTTVSGLAAGSYRMELHTVSTNGMMSNGSLASVTVPQTPTRPAPVTDVQALPGNGMVTISWLPASNGGSPITSYTVAFSANMNDVAAIIHPATDGTMFNGTRWSSPVYGLTNARTYTFYVYATNAIGTSQPATSNPATPGSPALSASVTTLQPGDSVLLTGRGFAPGSQIYVAMAALNFAASGNYGTSVADSAGMFSLNATLNRYPDGSLLQAGIIQLVAHTVAWNQTASVQLRVVTLGATRTSVRPGDLVTLTGNGFSPGVTLSTSMGGSTFGFGGNYGTAVADINGHFTIDVVLNRYPDGSFLHADTVVLMAHTADWTQKAGVQLQVLGNPSLTANIATLKAGDHVALTGAGFTPGKILTISMGSVNTAVGGNYGQVVADTGGKFTIDLPLNWYPDGSPLHAGSVVLIAHTADGAENASVQLQVIQAPGMPTNVVAQVGNGAATVGWNPPINDGGSPITSYTVSASPDVGNAGAVKLIIHPATDGWMFAAGRWTATIGGLVNGNTYTFYVFSANAAGVSQAAAANTITLGTVPSAVRNLAVTPGDGSLSLTWDAPSSDGSVPILRYQITASDGVHAPVVLNVTGTSATLTGLLNGTGYVVTINAVNALGPGGPTSSVATPRNFAPSITAPSTLTVHHGDIVSATISASGPELTDHLVLTASGLPNGVTFTDKGNGTGTLAGKAEVPAGTYQLNIAVSDSHNAPVSQNVTLTVTREQAEVRLFPAAPLSVMLKNAAQTGVGSLTIRSSVREATDPNGNADIGEAADVTYTLTSFQNGRTYSGKATTTGGGVEGSLTAKYSFHNVPRGMYQLRISVGGQYYEGNAEAMVAVSGPAVQGSVTGNGQVLVTQASAHGHFNFQIRRLTNGKLSGSLLYVEQRAGTTDTFQSTSISALVFKGHTAYIQGKGTLNGVGGHQFVATVIDNHHQAGIDRFGLRIVDGTFTTVNHCTFAPLNLSSGQARIVHG